MPTDNITLNAGSGGATIRTFADASGNEWPAAALCYFTTVSPGANVLAEVTASQGLPVAQQGTWTVGISGTVPVSGTFWQTTQPVSGTVAATQSGSWSNTVTQATASNLNATVVGTGTFAVQAAQSGTWTNTVTQATAASLNATVVGTGTFAVQASQSGTWNIGTVTTLTGITNALPPGTNLLGSIANSPQVASLYNGTTAVTPQYATFSTSASGTTSVVSAVSGKKVYVLRWSVSSNGNTNVNLQSHTTTSLATGVRYLTQYASGGGAYCEAGIMATASGEGLDVNNTAAIAISGEVTYVQF